MEKYNPYANLMRCVLNAQKKGIGTDFTADGEISISSEIIYISIYTSFSGYAKMMNKIDCCKHLIFDNEEDFKQQIIELTEEEVEQCMYVIDYATHLLSSLKNF